MGKTNVLKLGDKSILKICNFVNLQDPSDFHFAGHRCQLDLAVVMDLVETP